MAKGRSSKWVEHEYGKGVHAIRYRLKQAPKLSLRKDDGRTACAQIVQNEVIDEAALCVKITEEAGCLRYHEVKTVLATMKTVLLKEFRRGNRVTLDGFLSMKPAFTGRVQPERHLSVTRLPLVMNARFSESFNRLLNKHKTVQIHYAGTHQPCQVEVERIERFDNLLSVGGKFHNIGTLEVEVRVGDRIVFCDYELSQDSNSTRNLGKRLSVYVPKDVLPKDGSFEVVFSWIDATGTKREAVFMVS